MIFNFSANQGHGCQMLSTSIIFWVSDRKNKGKLKVLTPKESGLNKV